MQKPLDLESLSDEFNISIREDKQIEQRILENLKSEYSLVRDEIHVTDLVLCLRQSLFRKFKRIPPGIKQLGYFLDGARRHETLQKLYSAKDPAHIIAEKKGVFEGVSFSIDIYHNIPIEFKTTRASRAISDHWIRQLAYYMLAVDSNVGILQVQRIMPRDNEDLFPSYLLEFTSEEQRLSWLNEFHERRNMMYYAYDRSDVSMAPIYRGDNSWVCKECPYKFDCDAIEAANAKNNSLVVK